MSISENILKLREGAGVSQAELARRIGVTGAFLCQIERGLRTPSLPLAVEISKALGCSLGALVEEKGGGEC